MEKERDEEKINAYYLRVLEILRFSKMQSERLASQEVFNRHFIKVVEELTELIEKLKEAGASRAEMAPILEKYEEYKKGLKK